MIKSGKVPDLSVEDCQQNLKKALEKGVLKILSKMGISLLSCYHGAQIFEAYGLGPEVINAAFRGSVSRVGGMTLADLQRESESFWAKVRPAAPRVPCPVLPGAPSPLQAAARAQHLQQSQQRARQQVPA